MKKLAVLLSVLVILLAACGERESSNMKSKKVESEQDEKAESMSLKNNTAVLHDIDVKVLDTEYLPMGTYEGQQKPQLVVNYEVKNKVDKEMTTISGWIASFEAYQDTENSMKTLNVGPTPNMEKYQYVLDTQDDLIKKGKTVKSAFAYDVYDTNKPVILKARKGVGGQYLGEIKVELKK